MERSPGIAKKHDTPYGTLARLDDGRYGFTPDKGTEPKSGLFLTFPGDQPWRDRLLHPVFDGLVPEGWLLNIASRIRPDLAADRYGLLLAFGSDTVGAVSVVPAEVDSVPSETLAITTSSQGPTPNRGALCLGCLKPLAHEDATSEYHHRCATNLFGAPDAAAGTYDFSHIENIARHNLSNRLIVPGMQPKISLSLAVGKERRLTTPAAGEHGVFILKPKNPTIAHFPENEFFCMNLARAIGIRTATFGLIRDVDGRLHYLTRRFDRTPYRNSNGHHGRIAVEDFGQILGKIHGAEKYEASTTAIGKTILKLAGSADATEFFRTIYFSYLIGNVDHHCRNVSLITEAGIRLAPAYDITSTFLIDGPDDSSSAMLVNGKHARIRESDWERLAAACGLPVAAARIILDATESDTHAALTRMAGGGIFPPDWVPRTLSYMEERRRERDGTFSGRAGSSVADGKLTGGVSVSTATVGGSLQPPQEATHHENRSAPPRRKMCALCNKPVAPGRRRYCEKHGQQSDTGILMNKRTI